MQKTERQNYHCDNEDDRTLSINVPISYIKRCNRISEIDGESPFVAFYTALNAGLEMIEVGV